MTGSTGNLLENFYVYQYCGFIGHSRLNSTIADNPAKCWKLVKSLRPDYQAMPHRKALAKLKSTGITVRRVGKVERS